MPKLWNRLGGVKSILILQTLIGFGIVSNFAKEMIFAYYYGTGQEIELFRIAFGIPYSLFQTLSSAMVGVLLPIYLSRKAEDKFIYTRLSDQAQQIQFLIFIIGVVTAPLQARVLAPGYNDDLIGQLQIAIILCWLFYLIVSKTFPVRLFLQGENRKQLIAATSLILSLTVVAIILPSVHILHARSVWMLIAAHMIAAAVILVIYFGMAKRTGGTFKLAVFPNLKLYKERVVYGLIAASFLTVMITALQRVFDRSFASLMEAGTVASLEYAYNIYTALGLIIGTTAVLMLNKPIAERFHGSPKLTDVSWLLRKLLPIGLVCLVLAGLIYEYSQFLIQLIYEHGVFNSSDTHVTGEILAYLMCAFPFMVLGMVLVQIMYAAKTAKLLLVFGATKLIIKFIAMYWFAESAYATFGLSNLLCEVAGCLMVLGYLVRVGYRARGRNAG